MEYELKRYYGVKLTPSPRTAKLSEESAEGRL